MQLLKVKYLGATNTKGNRIKIINVKTNESKTLSKDYSINYEQQIRKYVSEVFKSEVLQKIEDYYIIQ